MESQNHGCWSPFCKALACKAPSCCGATQKSNPGQSCSGLDLEEAASFALSGEGKETELLWLWLGLLSHGSCNHKLPQLL